MFHVAVMLFSILDKNHFDKAAVKHTLKHPLKVSGGAVDLNTLNGEN
jgi:hypothetical protein